MANKGYVVALKSLHTPAELVGFCAVEIEAKSSYVRTFHIYCEIAASENLMNKDKSNEQSFWGKGKTKYMCALLNK